MQGHGQIAGLVDELERLVDGHVGPELLLGDVAR